MENLDVVVVPSIWLENSPLVIMEAQAAGLPVITTNLGGMAEMVRHEQTGLLFARNDVADLTRQLKRLINEPGLVRKLAGGIGPVRTTGQEYGELMPLFERLAPTDRSLYPESYKRISPII
jgi:glycosyltransferase involved in cell wall biosynthesis